MYILSFIVISKTHSIQSFVRFLPTWAAGLGGRIGSNLPESEFRLLCCDRRLLFSPPYSFFVSFLCLTLDKLLLKFQSLGLPYSSKASRTCSSELLALCTHQRFTNTHTHAERKAGTTSIGRTAAAAQLVRFVFVLSFTVVAGWTA